MLVSDIVRRNARYFRDCEAVVEVGGRSTTWAELDERSDRLAAALVATGFEKGDRLAILTPNCVEYIELFFGCAKAGVAGAPLNTRLGVNDLLSYLAYLEPRGIVGNEQLAAVVGEVVERLDGVELVVGLRGTIAGAVDYEALLASGEPGPVPWEVGEDDIYLACSTSGTTGVPKATRCTHRNTIAALHEFLAEIDAPERCTHLQAMPLFFASGGPNGMSTAYMKGGRCVILPAFDPAAVLRAIEAHRVQTTMLVPTMIQLILDHPECGNHDLSSLRAINCGGSPVSRPLLLRAREVFGDVFLPVYSFTEANSAGLILRRENQRVEGGDEELDRRLASSGKPMAGTDVRVLDDDGVEVPWDGATGGEIWLKGAAIVPEYFRMPEETASSRDGDWIRTGDVGVVDSDGFVTIVDRTKDMIITGGINVFSRELEEVLHAHPAVSHAVVIGVPDDRWGEAIHVLVVTREGAETNEAELIDHVATRLSSFKKPRSVEFVEYSDLPISGTGKILKRELRARYWSGHEKLV